ncbi:PHA/PHB synthase family protein [Sphingomonas solaris]|uniref:Class I poly(R)-hydroxyalkanoic acid synthase n=1 Tax=Alterirhizorhabdus solaris TaxID=2529389 RepID=A0A558R392_9SPHN|nr:class I poly(R)-hydroxyalkanoic acid synthase [Sphingomonas solaris]TVV73863.1 class I poly(R)-hydroxyalkanoic acid synthase [Sphingomonas solaris]
MIGRAQQLMLETLSEVTMKAEAGRAPGADLPGLFDATGMARMQANFWQDGVALWQRFAKPGAQEHPLVTAADKDRRFSAAQWRDSPVFDMIRQSYLLVSDHMLGSVDVLAGVDDRQREQLRFATRAFTEAMSPSNFFATNPQVLEKTIETRGANLLKGLEHMLADLKKGQLTQTDSSDFEVGRNVAATPGKVIHETALYQLIQYTPTTGKVLATPLVIFPPWINRFYILDLNPQKSFIRWAVEQGLTVFIVSWKSADASMIETTMEDYVLRGQLDAIDTVRDLLAVESVHTIGYCVAGTNLAALLAYLAARGEADRVASATFFTAQVDFSRAGELSVFIDDEQMKMIDHVAGDSGYLDGRYMAMTFNLLRGRDLIWNYVVNNYLLGQDYPPFDMLHWNSDTTNLPLKWHKAYLKDLYRDNKLVKPGAISINGTPIDLTLVETPSYIQAGREDHIAPAESVWKMTEHFRGPNRFVLAGSGHIAGVVNPPSSKKYQYWRNDSKVDSLEEFVAGAVEHKGSWWPDWIEWIDGLSPTKVDVAEARIPGGGNRAIIEDAPGRYVRSR